MLYKCYTNVILTWPGLAAGLTYSWPGLTWLTWLAGLAWFDLAGLAWPGLTWLTWLAGLAGWPGLA